MTAVAEISIRGGADWGLVTEAIAGAVGVAPMWERKDPKTAVSFGSVSVGNTTVSVTDNEPADGAMLILKVDDLRAAADRLSEIEADFDPDSRGRLWVSVGTLQLVLEEEGNGRDLESRASLYRAVLAAMPFVNALGGLSPAAAKRMGMTAERLRDLEQMVGRALWSSTADLQQQGQDELAAAVIARAAELTDEK